MQVSLLDPVDLRYRVKVPRRAWLATYGTSSIDLGANHPYRILRYGFYVPSKVRYVSNVILCSQTVTLPYPYQRTSAGIESNRCALEHTPSCCTTPSHSPGFLYCLFPYALHSRSALTSLDGTAPFHSENQEY